jgi:hypothetical protein
LDADKISQILDTLAQKLQGPAEQVFHYAVQNELTSAIIGLMVLLVVASMGYITCIILWKNVEALNNKPLTPKDPNSYDKSRYEEKMDRFREGVQLGKGTVLITVAFITIMAVILLQSPLHPLLNPEWYALSNILDKIK